MAVKEMSASGLPGRLPREVVKVEEDLLMEPSVNLCILQQTLIVVRHLCQESFGRLQSI